MFVLFCSLSSLFELVLFSNLFGINLFDVRFRTFFVRDVRSDVRFECSVICISLNLFKNVRAVEMFVWLLGLVVHLSVCWLRGRLLRICVFDFFLIRERPHSPSRTSCSPHIFTSIFPPHAAPESQTPSIYQSLIATFHDPFLSNYFRTWNILQYI